MRKAEICCGRVEDALLANQLKADRIELNNGLYLGGLTPTIASLQRVVENVNIPVICMDRVRPGGFCYSEEEILTMYEDAVLLLGNGADGIAFGMLNQHRELDPTVIGKMVDLIHFLDKEAIFHRAFDCVSDPEIAMAQLVNLHVDRVLTSGCTKYATDGKEILRTLQNKFGKKIEIVAASGLNGDNVSELLKYTGIEQAHTSAKKWLTDPTTTYNNVSFAYSDDGSYEGCDEKKIADFVNAVHQL